MSSFDEMLADAEDVFMDTFGEKYAYKAAGSMPRTVSMILTYNPEKPISENGQLLTDYVEVSIPNRLSDGITQVQVGRDQVTIPARYGAAPTDLLVVQILSGDGGEWKLACR